MAETNNGNQSSVAEHSAEAVKSRPAEHSAAPSLTGLAEHSVKRPRRTPEKEQLIKNKNNVVQLSAQRGIVYDRANWKRSRKKPGYLIRRMPGHSIAETEYGVSYLRVLSRKPDLTTADNSVYPLAGYFNWKSLEASGLLCKERKHGNREKTAVV